MPLIFNKPTIPVVVPAAVKAFCVKIVINMPLPGDGPNTVTYTYLCVDAGGAEILGSKHEVQESVASALTDPRGPLVYAALKARAYNLQDYGATGTVT